VGLDNILGRLAENSLKKRKISKMPISMVKML
jgi:hypothetical protein